MQLQKAYVGSIAVIEVAGEHLDASNAAAFKTAAETAVAGESKLLFDLSSLRFVDSSGLGALLSCLRRVNAEGAQLKLCGLSQPVRVLFELVRMNRIFDVYGDQAEGVESFAKDR